MNKLYPLLLALFLLAGCAGSQNYASSTGKPYNIVVESIPLFTAADITSPHPRSAVRNEQLLVVGRKAPNWFMVKQDGAIYYVPGETLGAVSRSGSGSGATSSTHDIQTGPRGGKYYINSNGNKTYIKRK